MFSLLVIDKVRLEEMRPKLSLYHLPKLVMVTLFAVLGVTLFAWVNIRGRRDPVLGRPESVTGIVVLFYFEATTYIALLIWLGALIVMTIPVATSKPYLLTRFLFASIPTGVCVISVLVGIFAGSIGPLNANALSAAYFVTMYNLYIWILAYGYWPVDQRFTGRNPTEGDRLFHNLPDL